MDTMYSQEVASIYRKLKRFTTNSLVSQLLEILLQDELRSSGPEHLPWITCLVLDWALIIEKNEYPREACSADISTILNEAWGLQSSAIGVGSSKDIELSFRPFILAQQRFQVPAEVHKVFLHRLHYIVCDGGKSFERDFENSAGVAIDEFFAISIFLIDVFNVERKIKYKSLVLKLYPKYSIETISKVIRLLGSSLPDIKLLASNRKMSYSPESYFAEPLAIRKPLLLLSDYVVGIHPVLVSQGISECFIRLLKSVSAQSFRDKFTRNFEVYLSKLISEYEVKFAGEERIKEIYRDKCVRDKKVVDFLCYDSRSSIYIDAKGVEPAERILVTDSPRIIKDKLKDNLLKGVTQAGICAKALRDIGSELVSHKQNNYILIVTHQDFYLSSGERLKNYLGDEYSDVLINALNDEFLIENVHFCCVGDFEGILSVCREAGCSLQVFLDYCTKSNKCNGTSKFDMRQQINAFAKSIGFNNSSPISSDLINNKARFVYKKLLSKILFCEKYWDRGANYLPEYFSALEKLKKRVLY